RDAGRLPSGRGGPAPARGRRVVGDAPVRRHAVPARRPRAAPAPASARARRRSSGRGARRRPPQPWRRGRPHAALPVRTRLGRAPAARRLARGAHRSPPSAVYRFDDEQAGRGGKCMSNSGSALSFAGNAHYARGLARALAGAALFGFPLMMTMEMWWLGFYIDRLRLLVLLVVTMATLIPLSYFVGFERTGTLVEDVIDAFVAFAIGALVSTGMLLIFGIIEPGMSAHEIVGKIAIQTVPASIG